MKTSAMAMKHKLWLVPCDSLMDNHVLILVIQTEPQAEELYYQYRQFQHPTVKGTTGPGAVDIFTR